MEKKELFEKDLDGNIVNGMKKADAKMKDMKVVEKGGFKVGKLSMDSGKPSSPPACSSIERNTERSKQNSYYSKTFNSDLIEIDHYNNKSGFKNFVYPSQNKENQGFNSILPHSGNLIKIPIRDYPPNKFEKEIKKIALNVIKPIENPIISNLNPEENQIFSFKIKDILDNLFTQALNQDKNNSLSIQQQEIKDQFRLYKEVLYEKTKKLLMSLIKSTQSELASLNSLEKSMLSKFSPPVSLTSEKSSEIGKKNFPQLLFNYNKTDGFISKDFSFTQHLKIPNTIGSTFLVLDNDSILMACAETSELLEINLNSLEKTKIIDLPVPKKYSALSYINNNIALIGGSISGLNAITDSVEILNNFNEWETIAKLNWPRSHCQAIQHKGITYIFAGYPIEIMSYIEKYHNGQWEILKFRLKENFACFGLASFKDEIFYFGGISKDNGKLRNFLGRINPDKDSEFVEKAFETVFVSNCSSSSSIFEGKFYYVDCIRGKVGVIPIE